MCFANNNNGGSQGCVRAPDATDHATDVSARSTAPLPQPSATSGHGELHELHVAKSTAENNQKGNHGNHAQGVFFAAFGVFCGVSIAPLTGPAYVLQRLQRVERSRVDGHVS